MSLLVTVRDRRAVSPTFNALSSHSAGMDRMRNRPSPAGSRTHREREQPQRRHPRDDGDVCPASAAHRDRSDGHRRQPRGRRTLQGPQRPSRCRKPRPEGRAGTDRERPGDPEQPKLASRSHGWRGAGQTDRRLTSLRRFRETHLESRPQYPPGDPVAVACAASCRDYRAGMDRPSPQRVRQLVRSVAVGLPVPADRRSLPGRTLPARP